MWQKSLSILKFRIGGALCIVFCIVVFSVFFCLFCWIAFQPANLGQPWPAKVCLQPPKATHHGRMLHLAKLRLAGRRLRCIALHYITRLISFDHFCSLLLVRQDPRGKEKSIVCETSWIRVGSTPRRQTPRGIPQTQIAPIRRRILQRPILRRMAHRLAAAQNKFCGAAQC